MPQSRDPQVTFLPKSQDRLGLQRQKATERVAEQLRERQTRGRKSRNSDSAMSRAVTPTKGDAAARSLTFSVSSSIVDPAGGSGRMRGSSILVLSAVFILLAAAAFILAAAALAQSGPVLLVGVY